MTIVSAFVLLLYVPLMTVLSADSGDPRSILGNFEEKNNEVAVSIALYFILYEVRHLVECVEWLYSCINLCNMVVFAFRSYPIPD